MKKSIIFLFLISFLFFGCTKTIKVDYFVDYTTYYSGRIEYDNYDGVEYEYNVWKSGGLVTISHYPRKTTVEQPSADSYISYRDLQLKEIEHENGELKSITVGNMKIMLK